MKQRMALIVTMSGTIKKLSSKSNPARSQSSKNNIIPVHRNDGQVRHGTEETLDC